MSALIWWSLVGCALNAGQDTSPFGGGDIGDFDGGDIADFDAAAGMESDDSGASSECGVDVEGVTSMLTLSASPERIDVAHTGVVDSCCATWEVHAAGAGEWRIEVTYTDTATACEGELPWTLTYPLSDLAPGVWTVSARGDEATVTVP